MSQARDTINQACDKARLHTFEDAEVAAVWHKGHPWRHGVERERNVLLGRCRTMVLLWLP